MAQVHYNQYSGDTTLHIEEIKNKHFIILFSIFILSGCSMITVLLCYIVYVIYLYIYQAR